MRVLCVLDNLSIASGVSSIVMNLYRNIDSNRIQMDFLVCNQKQESYESEIKQIGGKVFYTGNFLSLRQMMSATIKSKNFFAQYGKDYDVVHLHSPTIAMFTLKYAKRYGVPVRIVHSHSTMMSVNKAKNLINCYFIGQIKKYANRFFACSSEAACFLYGKDFCDTHRIEIIHNAVHCSKFLYDPGVAESIRKSMGIAKDTVFVHVSNYSPIKNHIFLLDVIERFCSTEKKVKFVFIGDGPTRLSFEKKLADRGLKKCCVFIDKTPEVAPYLLAADALLLPSLKEGLPVTLVEGQAAGMPFFTSDTVTREVRVGQGEFIPLHADVWYDKLSKFIPLSEKERKERSIAFQNSVFNIAVEANRVTSIYENLAKGDLST